MTDQLREALGHHNVKAFARVVRQGESSQDDEIAFKMRFPNKTFDDFSTHPDIREPIPWSPGEFSTAAGAFQITGTTDRALRRKYPFLKPSFTPEDQQERFVCLLDDCGALSYVIIGDFERAVHECVKGPIIWTSLPGGTENPQAMAKAKAVYEAYGGTYDGAPSTQPAAPIEDKSTQESAMPGLSDILSAVTPIASAVNPGAGLVLGLASAVINSFSGLAQEKLADKLAPHVGKPIADEFSKNVIDNTRNALNQMGIPVSPELTDIQVVSKYQEAIQKNPAIKQVVETSTMKDLQDAMPTIQALDELESRKLKDEDKSKDDALNRGLKIQEGGPIYQNPTFVLAGIVMGLVCYVVYRVLAPLAADQGGFSGDMKSLVIGFVMGTAFNAVLNFFFGSSRSSSAKDQVISDLANKK